MRVLITGARGQVGQSLREQIPENWEVIFTDSKTLDITNQMTVDTMVKSFQPDVIINTAAYTNVDKAEKEVDLAFSVNAKGVGNLAHAAANINAKLVHISTDHVFSGLDTTPYTIHDAPHPCNTYGQSKLSGELLALSLCPNSIVIRTSWVVSKYKTNFITTILEKSLTTSKINVVNDQYGRLTYADELSKFIIQLIQQKTPTQKIYHFCNELSMSRYELAQKIVNLASAIDNRYQNVEVHPIQTDDYSAIAKRPVNGNLNTMPICSLTEPTSPNKLESIIRLLFQNQY